MKVRQRIPLLLILLICLGALSACAPIVDEGLARANDGSPAVVPVAGQVQANDITIAYESFGPAEGQTVLLIAGVSMQLINWPIELVEGLVEQGYRVVRYDHRDVGLSTRFDEAGPPDIEAIIEALTLGEPAPVPYSFPEMAADAIGLLDVLEIEQAHLVGLSMGGAIAQLIAIDHPDRVLSLTLMAADSANPEHNELADPDVFANLPPPPPLDDVEAIIDYQIAVEWAFSGPGYPIDEATMRAEIARSLARAFDPEAHARQEVVATVGHLETAEYRFANLPLIEAPTVVLLGANDPIVPVAAAADLAARIPAAELRIIPGLGHQIPRAFAPELVDAITAAAARANAADAGRP
jgi:pimeloyl-ACP methyl ester carboxylesterase